LVLQSFDFKCTWWRFFQKRVMCQNLGWRRLFQKRVMCLNLIFTFFLHLSYLHLYEFKLSTNIHEDSDHFISWLFILWLVTGEGGVISHLPPCLVILSSNFSFINIRRDDVFAMNINSTFLLEIRCPVFNRFFNF
jgi:hypothetical protein